MNESRFNVTFIESLPKTVDSDTGCWLYLGDKNNEGYGRFQSNYVRYSVHRLSVSIFYDKDYFDYSWDACHRIECVNKHCFNPNHLYVGTNLTNMKDKSNLNTNCPKCGGPYTKYKRKTGDRAGKINKICSLCSRRAARIRRAKKKIGEDE